MHSAILPLNYMNEWIIFATNCIMSGQDTKYIPLEIPDKINY